MPDSKHLPQISRYITGHNREGLSVITSISEKPPLSQHTGGIEISQIYATQGFPANLEDDQDIKVYEHLVENPRGIVVSNGTACRIVDLPPNHTAPLHRSMSVNYNTVIEGEVELFLDSGETRLLKRGDTIIQRAVNHGWRNPSKTSWARMTAVVIPAQLPLVDRKKKQEPSEPSDSQVA